MNIFIPSRKLLTPREDIAIVSRVRGFYKLEAVRPDGSRRLLADWFPNLITNAGLDAIGNNVNYLASCFVGSGSTAPANTDTALVTLVGSTSNQQVTTSGNSGAPPWFGTQTNTYRFAAGTATGNLAEVGVGNLNNNLFSRALILDGVGAPTTITVLAAEALDVTYQLQNRAPTADVTGVITIAGVNYNYTIRAANANSGFWSVRSIGEPGGFASVTAYNGAIGTVTSNPAGANSGASSTVNAAYSAGTFQRDGTMTWGLTSGNLAGGITAFLATLGASTSTLGQMQIGLDAAIPKDGTKVLTISLRHIWARFP